MRALNERSRQVRAERQQLKAALNAGDVVLLDVLRATVVQNMKVAEVLAWQMHWGASRIAKALDAIGCVSEVRLTRELTDRQLRALDAYVRAGKHVRHDDRRAAAEAVPCRS